MAIIIIQCVKSAVYLKKILGSFFIFIIFKPLYYIFRFFFYKIIIKIYFAQRLLFKKLGWNKIGKNFFSFMFNQRLVHVLVILVTSLLLFINLSAGTRASKKKSRILQFYNIKILYSVNKVNWVDSIQLRCREQRTDSREQSFYR